MTRPLNEEEQRRVLMGQIADVRWAVESLHKEVARLTRERDAALEALRKIDGLAFPLGQARLVDAINLAARAIRLIETGAIHNDQ